VLPDIEDICIVLLLFMLKSVTFSWCGTPRCLEEDQQKIKIHTDANDKVVIHAHFITECYMYQHCNQRVPPTPNATFI
jgi:hypothetical protein